MNYTHRCVWIRQFDQPVYWKHCYSTAPQLNYKGVVSFLDCMSTMGYKTEREKEKERVVMETW